MDIIVIGTGMYVSGRGTDGYGTILPAILEFQRVTNIIDKVYVVGTNPKNTKIAKNKIEKLKKLTGVKIKIEYSPLNGKNNRKEYISIMNKIKKPSCAIIAVPDHLHHEICSECLKRKIHTLMVKPFTPTVNEGKNLIRLANKNNLYCAVEFHKRWDKQNLYLKDIYETHKLGEPLYTWTEYSQRKTIPTTVFRNWVEKSNLLQYLAAHYIDLISYITESKPIRVSAFGQKKWLINKGVDVHDSIQCSVLWKKNNVVFNQILLTNWIDPESSSAMSDQKIKFVGTKGRYEADQKERGIKVLIDGQSLGTPNLEFCQSFGNKQGEYIWKGYGIDSIFTYLTNLNKILNSNTNPKNFKCNITATFKDALVSTAVIQAAWKSLNNDSKLIDINL